jgi:PAS domain S-box-containing protein
MVEEKGKYKILAMAILLGICCFLMYYTRIVLGVEIIYTHFFYVPIILASLWWRRKGLVVAIFLGLLIIFSGYFIGPDVGIIDDLLRASMFMVIALVVCILSERAAKAEAGLKEYAKNLERMVDERAGELRAEKKFSENIIATIPDSLLVLDANLRIKKANRSFYEKFQTEPENVIGGNIADILPEDGKKLSSELIRLFGTEDILKDFELHYSSEKLGERTFNITARGILVAEEEEEELVVLEDITEQKQAEKELRESEERYHSLVESTEDSIYLVDRDCRYLFMNKKHLSRLGFTMDEIRGRTYGELHSEDDTKEFVAIVEEVFETGKSVQHEHRSHRDGRYFLRTLSPIKNQKTGEITAVTVISKDIADLKRVEEELRAKIEEILPSLEKQGIKMEKTGVPGLDEMIGGGFLSRGIFLVSGKPGTGKTIFSYQFLLQGAKNGRNGIIVLTDVVSDVMLQTDISIFGSELERYIKEGQIIMLDLTHQIEELKSKLDINDLWKYREYVSRIMSDLLGYIKKSNVSLIAIDTITPLIASTNPDNVKYFISTLSGLNCTVPLTKTVSGIDMETPLEERFVTGVIALDTVISGERQIRRIIITKMKGIAHDTSIHNYKITNKGLVVLP